MRHRHLGWFPAMALLVALMSFANTQALGQDPALTPSDDIRPAQPASAAANQDSETVVHEKGVNLLNLLRHGGWFMLPLGLLSIAVVAIGIERTIALRRDRMLPGKLVTELGQMAESEGGFDPRRAYQVCQTYPSAASRVLCAMLLKVGRPQIEVENAASEASQREATRLQSVVSWLTLAAAVAPLIGLLGTVWGISQAFYDTTQLVAGQNKAEVLAQGIYTALVTTMCGLVIAIPAAVLAHFYDNRIIAWFYRIEELMVSLTPQIEPFEGRLRTSANGFARSEDQPATDRSASPPESEARDSLPVASPATRPR